MRVLWNTTSIAIHLIYERSKPNLLQKSTYFFCDDRNCPFTFEMFFLYLLAGCICNNNAKHFNFKHCESRFVFAFDVLQLTLRLPLIICLCKRELTLQLFLHYCLQLRFEQNDLLDGCSSFHHTKNQNTNTTSTYERILLISYGNYTFTCKEKTWTRLEYSFWPLCFVIVSRVGPRSETRDVLIKSVRA